MTVIDCDAHVEEGLETWTYLDPKFHGLKTGWPASKEVRRRFVLVAEWRP